MKFGNRDIIMTATHPVTGATRELDFRNGGIVFKKELGEVNHRHTIDGKISFKGGDYHYFEELETDPSTACAKIPVSVTHRFGTTDTHMLDGYFSRAGSEKNPHRCKVEKPFNTSDGYECLNEVMKKKVNVLSGTSPTNVKTFAGVLEFNSWTEYDVQNLDLLSPGFDLAANAPTDQLPGNIADWSLIFARYQNIAPDPFNPGMYVANIHVKWAREDRGGSYEAPITVSLSEDHDFDLNANPVDNEMSIEFVIAGGETGILPGGRKMEDIINKLLGGCGLTIVSNFLNINPDGLNVPANDAYAKAATYLSDVYITQKSNVKRPTAASQATRLELTLEEFLDELKMVRVFHRVEGSIFRLEHISYYKSGNVVLDLTNRRGLEGLNAYTEEGDVNYLYENFAFMEEVSTLFDSASISYHPACANNESIEHRFKLTNNDVQAIVAFPEKVSDSGMVWLSTESINGEQVLIKRNIVTVPFLNGGLSLYHIVFDYWKHERLQPNYNVGSATVTAESVKKQRKLQELTVTDFSFQEWMAFDPNGIVLTENGPCEVIDAPTWTPYNCNLVLKLAF